MTPQIVDIAIVGGGLIGKSLAAALRGLPLKIALIEAVPPHVLTSSTHDVRSIGLSYGSYRIFLQLGLWHCLNAYATAIAQVNVSDKGHFGFTRIHAQQQGVEALGYNVEIHQLSKVLDEVLQPHAAINFITPAKVVAMQRQDTYWNLCLEQKDEQRHLKAKLVVAADGGQSAIRELLNFSARVTDYQQSAIVANLELSQAHNNIAYERFMPEGPMAFLPLKENHCVLIWTVPHNKLEQIMGLRDEEFLQTLHSHFGYRLGYFKRIGKRFHYPLKMVIAKQQSTEGVVLLGNATHQLHPVAAQGFNLGLRSATSLAHEIRNAQRHSESYSSAEFLRNYVRQRESDQRNIVKFTHGLVCLFGNDFWPLGVLRNCAMVAVDVLPGLKKMVAHFGTGASQKHLWIA